MTILKQISTHKAVKENGVVNIYELGLDSNDEELKGLPSKYFQDILVRTIPLKNEDDLFAIFDRFEEDNRCNANDFNS